MIPWRQCGQVPSLNANGAITKSPLRDVPDVGADVLDDADELVADRARLERRVAAVVPEVRAADAREHHAHDGVGGLGDGRVGPVADLDAMRFDEESSTHGHQLSASMAKVGGPAKGALTGHLWAAAAGVTWITWIPPRTSLSS